MTPFVQLLAGETPAADLAFADNVESWIFPQYLAHRSLRSLRRGLRDLFGDQGRDWRDPLNLSACACAEGGAQVVPAGSAPANLTPE